MLALSPASIPTSIGYFPSEEYALGFEDQNYFYKDYTCNDDLGAAISSAYSTHLNIPPPPQTHVKADRIDRSATPSTATAASSDHLGVAVKKLNHNASERDRRKKIGHLYSSLRSLLPASDHKKKLSIPATVSHVIKYVPELQREVQGLAQKREELLSNINVSRKKIKQESCDQIHMKNTSQAISLSSASANQLSDEEVSIQISSYILEKNPFSETLQALEEDGFLVLNASSMKSIEGRIFHNLHLKVVESHGVECGSLGGRLVSLCDNKELFSQTTLC